MSIRSYAKRRLMAQRRSIHLAGLGRVPRGAVIEVAMRHPRFGSKPFVIGWVKADVCNPTMKWGPYRVR